MADPTDQDAIRTPEGAEPQLWGLVVTFRRPEALGVTLQRIGEQLRVPDHIVVVDNGSDAATRRAVEAVGADYVDSRDNLGPAGGIALGMERILTRAGEDDWVILFDDDDPPLRPDVVSALWTFAASCRAADPMTAGVGVGGARYRPHLGVFQRVPDEELRGSVPVDYIGGGQFPLYSCRAIRTCGVFDRSYFFGFDDAEYGLRLRRAGYSLFAHGTLWHELRRQWGRLNLRNAALRTADEASSWRRYYAVRNATSTARRYATPLAVVFVACGGGMRAAVSLARARRPLDEVALPLRGAWDGLLGRGGRTVDPGSGEKTR